VTQALGDLDGGAALPRYVAIITDGNGRWAHARGLSPTAGHDAGADTLKARLRDAAELGIEELTVYSFSTENWSRPQAEVDGLIAMMASRIARETPELHEEGVRMRFIGRREGVPAHLLEQMDRAQALTDSNRRITLCIAFNYGGRAEILDAAARYADQRVAQAAEGGRAGVGGLPSDQSTEDDFSRLLYAPDMHDPELLIRTGREHRISNFVLWQAAYSEIVFRDELWPDFTRECFVECLREFSERRRNFGGRAEMAAQPHHDEAAGVTTVFEREE
jgi:undecaprenyl diphosphate synthase